MTDGLVYVVHKSGNIFIPCYEEPIEDGLFLRSAKERKMKKKKESKTTY